MTHCEAMEINYNVSGDFAYFPAIVSPTAGTHVGLVAGNVVIWSTWHQTSEHLGRRILNIKY